MLPTQSIFRATASLRPVLRTPAYNAPVFLRAALPRSNQLQQGELLRLAQRRWNTEDARGGKSKLVFRFNIKDIPVELYPIFFVVAAALVGATVAMGKHPTHGSIWT
ncbi:hypothetical protein M231_03473 [Tremella mesenterica]|uniref:Uncharacterized protein n=1 Tax=Tremella mesenterica TaxID=5217 RepID=A0A4Q1BN26_TREME|nr:hypothetical protein M231_03473 [Tremella mesenterica]